MLRSLLFVPGNNPGMLQSADVFGADAVIFDLEDSVHVAEKDNARNLVKAYLDTFPNLPKQIMIRINALDSGFFTADLDMLVSDRIDWIMLPKATVPEIKELSKRLSKLENDRKMNKKIRIMPIIELATSLIVIETIAAQKRVAGVLFGAEDYRADMSIKRTPEGTELFYPRSRIAVAARANKIDAIDTPFTDVTDDDALASDCDLASTLGMTGKAAIHPRQIQIINEHFSPSRELIDWANKVLKAKLEASKKGLGVFSLDGKMIDKPIISRAESIIRQAKACGLSGVEDEKQSE